MQWDGQPYHSLTHYYKTLFGGKTYKIALNAGLTCPNRDGKLGTRGCLFCSDGSASMPESSQLLSITDQINLGKSHLSSKYTGSKCIAYFQAFTNTYGDLDHLRKLYFEACNHPDVVGVAIATRPDCLGPDILALLKEVRQKKKLWLELGLQTIHEDSANLIRRGYPLSVFDEAVDNLHALGIDVVVHLILGLPYETKAQILQSLDYVVAKPISGIKLQLLHVLKETDLAQHYATNAIEPMSLNDYVDLVVDCIERTPERIVIHRITGDGPKALLIAPLWSGNKKLVLGSIQKRFIERATFQGKKFNTH